MFISRVLKYTLHKELKIYKSEENENQRSLGGIESGKNGENNGGGSDCSNSNSTDINHINIT